MTFLTTCLESSANNYISIDINPLSQAATQLIAHCARAASPFQSFGKCLSHCAISFMLGESFIVHNTNLIFGDFFIR